MDDDFLKNIKGKIIDDFEILNKFSQGGFSAVHFAKHIPTNTYCAVKIINLDKQTKVTFNGIMREISVFMQVEHPNISTFFRVSFRQPILFFFMEYSPNGTLLNYVNKSKYLEENEARRLFLQLFSVLRHLHAAHFLVHRDLKLENVLMDKENNIKLIDFGLSSTFYNNHLRTFVGSPGYQPPEIIGGHEYDEKCDVWSLGICLFAMLTSRLPFTVQTHNMRRLLQEAESFNSPIGISPQCSDILHKMLQGLPNRRPTLLQLQNHPWLIGLPPLPSRLLPTPITFYNVRDYSDILKFKRKPLNQPNQTILDKCCNDYHIDRDLVVNQLATGLVTQETTTYFILTNPLDKDFIHLPSVKTVQLPPISTKLQETKELISNDAILKKQTSTRVQPKINPFHKHYRRSLGLGQKSMKSFQFPFS